MVQSDRRTTKKISGYVNVCAAVCLLLLAGDLSPQSSAAPRPRRDNMAKENDLWANPCGWGSGSTTSAPKVFTKDHAQKVANQANHALHIAVGEKDEFKRKFAASIYFDENSDSPWLRNFFTPSVFSENKMSPEDLSKVTSTLEGQLPDMYYALKMVTAGLYAIKERGLDLSVKDEKDLKPYFDAYFNAVKLVLCEFSDGISQKDNTPLMDDEIPSILPNRLDTMFMIYRDSMLYLNHLRQVMEHWVKTD